MNATALKSTVFATGKLAAALFMACCLAATASAQQANYVFLIIGDGMGTAQRALGEACLPYVRADGEPAGAQLVMNALPVHGMSQTAPHGGGITDSAAAGTAIACGRKTRNGMLGIDPDGQTRYPTLAQIAKKRGMKVGIVTSVSIDHATPAAFYAHVKGRGSVHEIAMALAHSDFDYFGGGPALGAREEARKDRETGALRPCPIETAQSNGFTVISTRQAFAACTAPAGKIWAFDETLGRKAALPYAIDREPGDIGLAEFTRKGIELLTNTNGFFMMIEGGKIDWACHDNEPATVAREVLDFDRTVAEVLKFYEAHPDETLVIVTGDHETGGLQLPDDLTPEGLAVLLRQKGSSNVYRPWLEAAIGNGWSAERVMEGVIDFFGFDDLSPDERNALALGAERSLMPAAERKKVPDLFREYGGRDPAWAVAMRLQAARTGIKWTTGGHTAQDVPTTAIGVGARAFAGTLDNTEFFPRILAAMDGAAVLK